MAQGSSKQIVGLVAIVGLAVGLWLWLRPSPESDASAQPTPAAAKAATAASGGGLDAKDLRRSDIDPLTAPKATLAGTVRDEAGQPIAGAQVCAKISDSSIAGRDALFPTCTQSREDGTFRLQGLLGTGQVLHASARGYLPTRYRFKGDSERRKRSRLDLVAGETREGIEITLKEGGVEVQGVVRDISGGEIEGAMVWTRGRGWFNGGSTYTRSDDEGRFTLWVEGPSTNISAMAEGYGEGSRSAAVPGTFVELFLTPESVVVGKVVWAESGKAVANVKVSAGGGRWFSRGNSSAYTAEDGTFRLEGLEPGSYKITASDDELTGISEQKVHVGLGETSDPVEVRVHAAFTVRGTVLVDGKEPCPYGQVRLKDTARKGSWGRGHQSQSDGSVLIKGLLPSTYEVTVTCEGYVAEEDYEDIVIADASVSGQTWSVHAGLTMRGTVVDADGKPVEGAFVSARMKAGKDPRAQLSNSWGERTESNGAFELAGLLAGAYQVEARHPDMPSNDKPTDVDVAEGKAIEDLVLTLPAGGGVTGTVRDETGSPVKDVSVRLTGPRWNNGARTNDEGKFVLEGIQAGDYRIQAQRGWTDTIRAPGATDDDTAGERITVKANEVSEVDLVVESQNGRITGRVVDEGGGPVADAFVDAVRESDSAASAEGGGRQRARWGSWSRQPVLTDEDGRFELENLAEGGTYSVYANRKGGGEAVAEHVAAGTDVELSVELTGVLAGVVKLSSGGFPERFEMTVTDRTKGIWERDRFLRTDGQWTISNLPAGKFEVTVECSEGTSKVEVELPEGGENTDIELTLTPRVNVTGRLVDADTGEPVPGMKVSINGDGGIFSFDNSGKAGQKNISDAQGNFEVEDAATGKVNIVVMSPNFADDDYGWTWMPKRLPTEPRTQDVGTIEMIKKRVDRGDERGDLGFKRKEDAPDTEPEDVRNVVAFVRPGGPAATAGLKVGDEIVKIDGYEVTGAQHFRYGKLTMVKPGRTLTLDLASGKSVKLVSGPPV